MKKNSTLLSLVIVSLFFFIGSISVAQAADLPSWLGGFGNTGTTNATNTPNGSSPVPSTAPKDGKILKTECKTTAADCYVPLAPLTSNGKPIKADFANYIKGLYEIVISLASVIAVLMIVYGGILYMSSDAYSNKTEGKEIIQRTLWGIALIIGAWLILFSINSKATDLSSPDRTADAINNNYTPNPTGNSEGGLSSTKLNNIGRLQFDKPQGGQAGEGYDYGDIGYVPPEGYSNGGTNGDSGTAGINLVIDITGFSTITLIPNSREIYVSSLTGNDGNQGTSGSPVQSIGKALNMIRSNSSDHILLRRGETWNEGDITLDKSGDASDKRIVIGSFGTGERPKINVPNGQSGFIFNRGVDNIAIVGIHLVGAGQRNGRGISLIGAAGSHDILVEDCYIEQFQDGISLDATGNNNRTNNPIRHFTLRRSIIANNYPKDPSAHSQGIYAAGVSDLKIEDNVFDHNGWRVSSDKTIFNHNMYIQQNSLDVTVRNNIIARGSSHGVQARGGGTIEENLFLDNAYAALLDQQGVMRNNVVIGSHDIATGAPGGTGLEISRYRGHNITVENNLMMHQGAGLSFPDIGGGINLGGAANPCHTTNDGINASGNVDCDPPPTNSMDNITIQNNVIFDWKGNFISDIKKDNTNIAITNNSWNGRSTSYPHPEQSINTYNGSLGGSADLGGFLVGAKQQSKINWRPAYTAAAANRYLRAAFGM